MRRRRPSLAPIGVALLGTLALSACSMFSNSTVLTMRPEGTWSLFGDATARGGLPLTVLTSPLDPQADSRFDQVATGIREGITRRSVTVTRIDDSTPPPALRSIWMLPAGLGADPNRLCAASGADLPEAVPPSDGAPTLILAVFCKGVVVESAVRGMLPAGVEVPPGTAPPVFGHMARQLFDHSGSSSRSDDGDNGSDWPDP